MANLQSLKRSQLVEYALLSSQNAIEVLRFLRNDPQVTKTFEVVEAIASTPYILSELVQELFFGFFLQWGDSAACRQLLFHTLDTGRHFDYPRSEVALKTIVASKGLDALSAVMMLARGTPQAVVNLIIQRFAIRGAKVYGQAQVSRLNFLKLMVDLCGEGEIEWHNNYVSAIFSIMLYDQADVVIALVKASNNLPRPIVEAVLGADFENSPPAVSEVRRILMQKPGWWTTPAEVLKSARTSDNPDGVLSDYINADHVDVQNRIVVLESVLGLRPETPELLAPRLNAGQLSKVVGIAARQEATEMFQLCLGLLQGYGARLTEFIQALVANLTINPMALQRTAEVMQVLRSNQVVHFASPGFIKHYNLIYERGELHRAPAPFPAATPPTLEDQPQTDTERAPVVRNYRRDVLSWYQEALFVESAKKRL